MYKIYKQQKFLNISSTIWALIVTAIVLLIATSANAQDTDGNAANEPLPTEEESNQVEPVREVETTVPSARRTTGVATTSTERTATTTRSANNQTLIQERRAAIVARQAALQEKREALQNATSTRAAVLREAVRSRVTSGIAQIAVTLNRAIVSQQSINDRLQAKAMELETRGIDTTAIQASLARADELLTLAEEALAGIDTNARYAASSETPRDDWDSVREQVAEVRELLREARQIMQEALVMLRAQLNPSE